MNDVVGMLRKNQEVWDEYTRPEEYFDAGYDRHTRFLFTASSNPDPCVPRVSAYLQDQGYVAEYPDDHPFAVVLSHDVDDVTVAPRHLVFAVRNAVRHREVSSTLHLARGFLNPKKSPYRTFQKIMELERKYDAMSSFYFLASPDDVFGKKYTLQDVEGDMKRVLDAGCEVGFHTGFSSYDDLAEIKVQKKDMEAVLGSPVIGARNHVMRFKTPQTWEVLAKAGFRYDSTYGYPDRIGFRNGISSAFIPFDLRSQQEIPILEVPVMVQDWTMMYWMELTPQESLRQVTTLMDTVAQYHGVLTVLWHSWTYSYPASFGGFFTPDWTGLYEKILQQAKLRNAWITNTKSLNNQLYNDVKKGTSQWTSREAP
jgi:hypothetical protein